MLQHVSAFYDSILNDYEGHRYRSWEHCFSAFGQKNTPIDYLSLHLGFYLASWGMYRGSSGLLWKDYTIHKEAVRIIHKYQYLYADSNKTDPPIIGDTIRCFNELKSYYSTIQFNNGKKQKHISPTDTLITKIMLGTLGVTPAFDRYFILGVKNELPVNTITIKQLSILFDFAEKNTEAITACQQYISDKTSLYYPPMKIIDMYFWQKGFKLSNLQPLPSI